MSRPEPSRRGTPRRRAGNNGRRQQRARLGLARCCRCYEDAAMRLRARVRAAFFAEAERSAADRDADAAPPSLPPFLLEACDSALPRPLPDFLPPPDSLLTVAHARRFASFADTPRS